MKTGLSLCVVVFLSCIAVYCKLWFLLYQLQAFCANVFKWTLWSDASRCTEGAS